MPNLNIAFMVNLYASRYLPRGDFIFVACLTFQAPPLQRTTLPRSGIPALLSRDMRLRACRLIVAGGGFRASRNTLPAKCNAGEETDIG